MTVCKHCDHETSILWILWRRFRDGELPACPGCGAHEGTLEVASDDGQQRLTVIDEGNEINE